MPVLSRFFVIVGHVAIRQLVHLDTYVFSEIKRRNHIKEEHEMEKKKKKKDKNKRKSLATSASEVSMRGVSNLYFNGLIFISSFNQLIININFPS